MADKSIDMFKLVEEVEKQKAMDIDAIFSDLDSVKNEEVTTVKKKVYASDTNTTATVSKPRIPDQIGSFETRFERSTNAENVPTDVYYGVSNVNVYVEGHRDALEKYYKDAYNNSKDLYVIEARVNDEINRYGTHSQLYEKGYYDGLFYVLKALKRSKELLMTKLNSEINRNL